MSCTGIDAVPKLPKCPVAVLLLYRTYQSVRYRYESLYRYRWCRGPYRTELTEVSATGIDVVSNLPKCPVPGLKSYPTYRSVRYRQYLRYIPAVGIGTYRTEHTLAVLHAPRQENQINLDPDSKLSHFRPPHKTKSILTPTLKSSQLRSPTLKRRLLQQPTQQRSQFRCQH